MSDIDIGEFKDLYVTLPNGKRALSVSNAGGPFDIFQQDQTTPPFQYFMMTEDKTDITLTAPVAVDDNIINVSSGHGFSIGNMIVISEGDSFEQAIVKAVDVNAITINIPSAGSFTIGARVIRGNRELNIDGTTPKEFCFRIYGENAIVPIDVIGAKVSLLHAAAGDLSLFGGIAELANGFYLRKTDGQQLNLANYKRNQDFEDFGWNIKFDDRGSGGGEYSTIADINMIERYGIALRVFPSANDYIKGVIRDNLTTLLSMRIMLYGHFTQGEQII